MKKQILIQSNVKKLVEQNKIQEALQFIDNNIEEDWILANSLILLQGRFSSHQHNLRKGIITKRDSEIILKRIKDNLLETVLDQNQYSVHSNSTMGNINSIEVDYKKVISIILFLILLTLIYIAAKL